MLQAHLALSKKRTNHCPERAERAGGQTQQCGREVLPRVGSSSYVGEARFLVLRNDFPVKEKLILQNARL